MRIILTGAQGTGKTTLLRLIESNSKYKAITNVCRNLSKQGVSIDNKNRGTDSQKVIFDTYYEILSKSDNYVSDRGLTDVLAYSWESLDSKKLNIDEFNRESVLVSKFKTICPDTIYFYIPIEFPAEDDGIRSVDEEFRKKIDSKIKKTLDRFHINYTTITGSVENRYNSIMEEISKKTN